MIDNTLNDENGNLSYTELHRADEIRKQLLLFSADSNLSDASGYTSEWTPVWSSFLLEQTIEQIFSQAETSVKDFFRVLWDLLAQTNAPLTQTMAYFLQDIVRLLRWGYRALYEKEDFGWMAILVNQGCTEAQAYLALWAGSLESTANCREAILTTLKESQFITEAQEMLAHSNSKI